MPQFKKYHLLSVVLHTEQLNNLKNECHELSGFALLLFTSHLGNLSYSKKIAVKMFFYAFSVKTQLKANIKYMTNTEK